MLIRFLLFTILAYFIFRWLDGFFRPQKSPENKSSVKKSRNQQNFKNGSTKSVIKDNIGDYVDFEEVEEKKKK